MFSRPILVTGFNRPDLLELVLDKLTFANCSNVYIAIDGPRESFELDMPKVLACRELAESFNSLNPERNRLLQSNLGCGLAMSSAIDWFFDNVEEGIIIEDDIDFDISFLETMDFLLSKLSDDLEVGSITGLNPISSLLPPEMLADEDSFISHPFFSSWGWGTWKNRWQKYEFDLNVNHSYLSEFFMIKRFGILGGRYFNSKLSAVRSGKVDTWDYQFLDMQLRHNLRCIAPVINQIANLGFRDDATHTKTGQIGLDRPDSRMKFENHRKPKIYRSREIDFLYLRNHYRVLTFWEKVSKIISVN
jgi:hypothetical protein